MFYSDKESEDPRLKRKLAKAAKRQFSDVLGRNYYSNMERFNVDPGHKDNQLRNKCPLNEPHSTDGHLWYWGFNLDNPDHVGADAEADTYVPPVDRRTVPAPFPTVTLRART